MRKANYSIQDKRKRFYRHLSKFCEPIQQRYVVSCLLASGLLFGNMQRICFYITLVDMTRRTDPDDYTVDEKWSVSRCPRLYVESAKLTEGEYKDWSDTTQGLLLASFFFGHMLSCIVGGILADKYGAKQIFGGSVILTSLCSLLTPPFAMVGGAPWVMTIRGLMGFVQGPMFPAAASMLTKWSPRHERAFMSAFTHSAVPMATFLGNLLAGMILDDLNWQWVFYIFSLCGLFWYVLWQLFAFSSPDSQKTISVMEKIFIKYTIYNDSPSVTGEVPIMESLLSFKFQVVAYANFGFDCGFYIVSMELPTYLRNVLNFPIMKIGVVSAMPWLSMFAGTVTFGYISHYLITNGIIRKLEMRKIMAIVSTIVPAVFLILASWASCAHVLVCLFLSVSMFYAGAVYSGVRLSVVDLAPNYAGLTTSLVGTFGDLAGLMVPVIVQFSVTDGGTLMEWRLAFWIATVFMMVLIVPYVLFVTTSVQPWNAGTGEGLRLSHFVRSSLYKGFNASF